MCPDLVDPVNGMVMMTGNSEDDTATYSCDPGFELVGEMTRICQSNSEWSGAPPICRRRFIVVSLTIQSVYRTECVY